MATPIVRTSGSVSGVVTGDRNDLDIAETVTLADLEPTNSGGSYQWTLEDKPIGSSSAIVGPTSATATFVPDQTGTYRIRCTVNGTSFDVLYVAVPLVNTGARIPSFQEDATTGGGYSAGGNTKGWHEAMTVFMRNVDSALATATFPGYGVSGNISTLDIGDVAAAGGLATVARADHSHPFPVPTVVTDVSGSASALGSSAKAAREDHSHYHGVLSGPTFHALATTSAHGFMSSADKAATIVTVSAEASLANSRRLAAGMNITFDITAPGVLTINSSGGGGTSLTIENPNGTPLTQRSILAFSNLFTATDNVDTTDVTLANTAVTAGSYTYAGFTVDAQGRLTAASSGATPALASTTISAGTGLSGGGDLSANRSFALADTAVTAGSYTYAGFTVDAQGRLTAASSGATPALASRTVTGTGALGGGGDLSTNRTITVNAHGIDGTYFRQSAGLSVVGNATNATADVADITATTVGHVLTVLAGPTLGWAAPAASGANALGTYIVQTSANAPANAQILGALGTGLLKNATTTGVLSIATAGSDYENPLTFSSGVTRSTDAISVTTNGITNSMIRQGVARSVIGVTGNATANVADIQGTADQVLVVNTAGTALAFGTLAAGAFADTTIAGSRLSGFTNTTLPIANSSGQLTSSSVTLASNVLTHAASSSGADVSLLVSNTSNTASATARITARVAGSSTGNAGITLGITGGSDWTIDNENQTGDRLAMARAGTTYFAIDPASSQFIVAPGGTGVTAQTTFTVDSISNSLNISAPDTRTAFVKAYSSSGSGVTFGLSNVAMTIFGSVSNNVVLGNTASKVHIAPNGASALSWETNHNTVFFPTVTSGAVGVNSGSGVKVITIGAATTEPTTEPTTSAALLWAFGGKLKTRGIGFDVLANQTVASATSLTWDAVNWSASTLTLSAANNVTTATGLNLFDIKQPTITSGSALTVTNAATLRIAAAPLAAGSTTITNAYSLWIDAGLPRIDSSAANGSVATTLGSVGPSGSNTTVQEWLKIDINGTARYIPCF